MAKRSVLAATLAVAMVLWTAPASPQGEAEEVATAERLAALLHAARSVVSAHQDLINDPDLGDKGLSGERVVDEAIELYQAREGEPLIPEDMPEDERALVEATMEAIREIVEEHQDVINEEGLGFKGFIPAVFGRLVAERFGEKAGEAARMKVTAPLDLVRNRKALPDEWERTVIETRFLGEEWPKGEPFHESAEFGGRPAFRMLIPEYYSPSCLSCHGEPQGEVDVTGYPKEGGREGDLGGATSITLFR